MLAYANVALLMLCCLVIGFVIGVIVLDEKKHDDEEASAPACSTTRHVFANSPTRSSLYCLCGREAMKYTPDKQFYIIKT